MEANNMKAMRELAELVAHMNDDGYWDKIASIRALVKKAKAALAAPPRNCDVGTVGEQDDRFAKFCNSHFVENAMCDKDCPCHDFNMIGGACSIVWEQLPYESEVSK